MHVLVLLVRNFTDLAKLACVYFLDETSMVKEQESLIQFNYEYIIFLVKEMFM